MRRHVRLIGFLAAMTGLAAINSPAQAADDLQKQVAAVLAEAGPGIRWGMVVADQQGRELVAIDPDGRYVPASNTKLFTTAAALWKLPDLDRPDTAGRLGLFLI